MTGDNDGAGALNRVIEIECKADKKVIEDGHRTSGIVKENYGTAGALFIQQLSVRENMDKAQKIYTQCYEACMKNDTTEKQAMAAALIITADKLATQWLFHDGLALTIADMTEFLKSRETVSAADRGYNYMCDWVSQNANKLCGKSDVGDVYGDIGEGEDYGWVYVVRSVWNKVCQEASISAPALLSHLNSRGLLKTRGRAMTKNKRINGIPTECVVMKLKGDTEDWVRECETANDIPPLDLP